MEGGGIPRPEHPRPDFMRSDWINLNGEWDFAFDGDGKGENNRWYEVEEPFDKKIIVPFPYQSKLSGINDESFHDIIWYRRQFDLPDWWSGRTLLHIGAIDYHSKVWVNGKLMGDHVGGYSPIDIDLTGVVLRSGNSIVIEAIDKHGDQPRGKQDSRLRPSGCTYMRVSGIWQTVWLELVGTTHIEHFRLIPDLDGRNVQVTIKLSGDAQQVHLNVKIMLNGAELARQDVNLSDNPQVIRVPIKYVRVWSPECPDLYKIEFDLLRGEELIDHVSSYFGMRTVSAKGKKFLLNGRPCYMKMALDQGYYPDGIYTAPSDLALRRDVEAIKELGLNGVRKHQMPPDPRYLYWADKIGILVWEEMADWGMGLRRENLNSFLQEWQSVILRDFNHPSVVVWVPFNERDPGETPEALDFITRVYKVTKELDPTRLVVDNSGYTHTTSDIIDIHDYSVWHGGFVFKDGWKENKRRKLGPYSPHKPLMFQGFKYRGQPVVISEYGGWGIKGRGPMIDRDFMSYGPALEDEHEFISKYRDVTSAIMAERSICGFCYTQLYDVEGEVNGFLTYDRRWKVPPGEIRKINEGDSLMARLHL